MKSVTDSISACASLIVLLVEHTQSLRPISGSMSASQTSMKNKITYMAATTISVAFRLSVTSAQLSAKTGGVPADFGNRTAHREAEHLG